MTSETQIEFDPVKSLSNFEKHGVYLTDAVDFDWDKAQIKEDIRFIYAENRFEAMGWLGTRLHVVIYCKRGDKRRVISLRKANQREFDEYVDKT